MQRPIVRSIFVALVSGLIWHTVVDYGFLRNGDALLNIASRFDRVNLPTVTKEQLWRMISSDDAADDVVIVDARGRDAYERGHVPGAINVPLTVTHGDLRTVLAAIPVDKRIVVYCQSKNCGWSDTIGQQFAARSYHRVVIFREGMNGWKDAGAEVEISE